MPALKRLLKAWTPPALLKLMRGRREVVRFGGSYDSWAAAAAAATGYDAPEILRRVADATQRVLRGEAKYERDSVLFDHTEYSWPLLASLLQVAAELGSLRVIDFGGSLGSTYRQNSTFLRRLGIPVSWRIVEQPEFVAAGRAEFSDHCLSFHDTVAEAGGGGVDVGLFASSLCYIEHPLAAVQAIEALLTPFMIIDRLPVVTGEEDRIALQEVFEPIYPASYPVRLFGEDNLLRNVLRNWRLIESWDCGLQPDDHLGSISRGYFLERTD
jgi:putative methyltransferase (TIGR04325 family)